MINPARCHFEPAPPFGCEPADRSQHTAHAVWVRGGKKSLPQMLALFSIDGLLLGTVIWLDVFKDLLCRGKGQQLLAVALLEY